MLKPNRLRSVIAIPLLLLGSTTYGQSVVQDKRIWSIDDFIQQKALEDYVYYGVRGNTVWGHTFGFLKPKSQCDKDLLLIKWSTHKEGIQDIVGQDLTVSFNSEADSFNFEIPLDYTHKEDALLARQVLLYGYSAGPLFFDALDTTGSFTISIDQSNYDTTYLDIPEDNFLLEGLRESRYKAAIKCLNIGEDPSKMVKLSNMLLKGMGVFKDDEESDRWFYRAAENGHPRAAATVGVAHFLNQRYDEAKPMLEVAAKAGIPIAAYHLADMLYNGKGIEVDIESALYWAEKSVTDDDPKALYRLATILYQAPDPLKDKDRAVNLFKAAAEGGHANSMVVVANIARNDDRLSDETNWLLRAATLGHSGAIRRLVAYFIEGQLSREALSPIWGEVIKAIKNNQISLEKSSWSTDELYLTTPTDYINAAERLSRAAITGIPEAQFVYAKWLRDGLLIGGESYVEAISWLKVSEINGYKPSQQTINLIKRSALRPVIDAGERLAALCIKSEYEKCKLSDLIEELN